MKTFISFLGTGFYGECIYTSDGFKSNCTRFIQEATLDYIKADLWDSNDKIVILLTDSAKKNNWDEKISKRKKPKEDEDKEEEYVGLEKILKGKNYNAELKGVDIVDGKNEAGMWAIFNSILNEIREGDELYFDLTHSFRYLPMLMLVLGNYSKFIKNTSVVHVSYGNYEARINGEAPIVDLLPLSLLQDWTEASDSFVSSGSAVKLLRLVEQRKRITKGKDPQINNIKNVVKSLNEFLQEINTCQGRLLYEAFQMDRMKSNIKIAKERELPVAFSPILDKVDKCFEKFSPTPLWKNVLNAAVWCFAHQQYQQSITLLRETCLTVLCEATGLDWKKESDRARAVSYCVVINDCQKDSSCDVEQIADKKGEVDQLGLRHIRFILGDGILMKWALLYMNTAQVRNQYNHAGFLKESALTPKNIISIIKKQIEDVVSWDNDNIPKYLGDKTLSSPVFVNVSNHHSSKWTASQKEAALEHGEIIDLPFPNVDPNMDEKELDVEVNSMMRHICEITNRNTNSVIHVMGEMTFTYRLVTKLKKGGYNCVASTTERIVTNNPDGTKTAMFNFVKFRGY